MPFDKFLCYFDLVHHVEQQEQGIHRETRPFCQELTLCNLHKQNQSQQGTEVH
jgi:hypothetical protein